MGRLVFGGMIGRKVGMMRLYDGTGRVRPVTAIELGPNRVTQIRTVDRDGYAAMQVGFQHGRKRMTQPARGHLRSAGIEEQLGTLREFPLPADAEVEVGAELTVADIEPGQYVSVAGVSKGRGFAGVVRRWNFRGGPKTHGQSDRHRAPGSVGAGTTPGKVWKGQKMGGHMGSRTNSQLNLLVVSIDPARNLIFVQGSVAGTRSGLVTVAPGRRSPLQGYEPPEPFEPPEEVVVAPPIEVAPAVDDAAAEGEAPADGGMAVDESPRAEADADAPADDDAVVETTGDAETADEDEEKSGEGAE
jgi:large subunit ribosomal protein L3